MLLIDKINENLKEYKFKLDLESAKFSKKGQTLSLVFCYADNLLLSAEIKEVVQKTITTEFGEAIKYNIKFKKNYFDEQIIQTFILEQFRREYPMVGIRLTDITLQLKDGKNEVGILLDNIYKEFVDIQAIIDLVSDGLKNQFKADFEISIEFSNILPKEEISQPQERFDYFKTSSSSEFEIELDTIEPYIGELIDMPIYPIASFKNPQDGIAVCGRIENLQERQTKPKETGNGKERPSREYFNFDLVDYSGKMKVVYFPGKANLPKFKKLENGSEIAIFGKLEEDSFKPGLSLRPQVVNLCVTKKGFYDQIYSLPVPKNYTRVFPEKYISEEQSNLFVAEKDVSNEYLLANDFVVFDLETTGVNCQSDKIIEIGAVKIVQGKLCETFGTLVNPECHIPEDATRVNNITDEDVVDAPTLAQVMPDFYKFCDGCVIVSYVIGFDFGFIDYHGKALGYTFTNQTDDAFVLAKNKLKGLKNYKLVTVAKHLGVSLENAHRAVHDAVATAECMVKLLEEY